MRGLTTHSRRDRRNARRVGRTVWDLLCTGALEVGEECLVWRLAGCCPSRLGGTDGCSRTAPYPCAATRGHRSTLAQPHVEISMFLKFSQLFSAFSTLVDLFCLCSTMLTIFNIFLHGQKFVDLCRSFQLFRFVRRRAMPVILRKQ